MNKAFCELSGHAADRLLGKSDYDVWPAEEAAFFRSKDEELFATEREMIIDEEPVTSGSGARRILATRKVPLRDASGAVTHLVGITTDITEVKVAEDALRRNNEELERRVQERTAALAAAQEGLIRKERLAVLGQLAGGLAHQVRNPLAAIKNAAHILERLLRDHPSAAPDAADALSVIHDEVESANRTVTDLLDYARVRAPMVQTHDVGAIVSAVLSTEPTAPLLVVRDLPKLPPVAVDSVQLHNALSNIVRNAVEAMPSGGTLTLSARREGHEVVLTIADTGPGIPEEIRKRLFEPLVTTKTLGLGLGLVTARSLIENQQGRITWTSSPEGTQFSVTLPIAE